MSLKASNEYRVAAQREVIYKLVLNSLWGGKGIAVRNLILSILLLNSSIFAHATHVMNTTVRFEKTSLGEPLQPNEAEVEIQLNWQQLLAVIETGTGKALKDTDSIPLYADDLFKTISAHTVLMNGKEVAKAVQLPFPQVANDELIFGRGVIYKIRYTASAPFDGVHYKNSLLGTDPNYRNLITVMNSGSNPIAVTAMTDAKDSFSFFTDPAKNPTIDPEGTAEPKAEKKKLMDRISSQLVDLSNHSLLAAMGLVFMFGMLHTLEAGHSKLILGSFMLNSRVTIGHGIGYALIFTLTHIADIILMGIILLIVDSFVDIYSKMSMLQSFSIYALVVIATVMLTKNINELLDKKSGGQSHSHGEHSHSHDGHSHEPIHASAQLTATELAHAQAHGLAPNKSLKEQLMLGFVTGLAPCLMGWSIFMVIMSTGNLWSLFPILLSFGLGIFVALAIVVVGVGKTRHLIYGKFGFLQKYSPLLSSTLLLAFALHLAFK